MNTTKNLRTLSIVIFSLIFSLISAAADNVTTNRVPETAKDHYAMAEQYQKVAAQNREDIAIHKKMLADFTQGVAQNPKAGENPYVKKMRQHCEKYIKAAAALEAEAEASARFHTLRAREMEGK